MTEFSEFLGSFYYKISDVFQFVFSDFLSIETCPHLIGIYAMYLLLSIQILFYA